MAQREVSPDASPSFLTLLRVRPFAVLFLAEAQSLVGDQLARVALSILVLDRTGSAAATAITYALTFLPAILGGFLLARVADHFPRPDVLVSCDVFRAALFAAMVLPGVPLIALELLLVLAVFLEPVFSAAQSSCLADRLSDEQYRSATGFRMATNQLGQIGGFALGGTLVALVDPRGALAINALTFLGSAIVIFIGLHRPSRAERAGRLAQLDESDPAAVATAAHLPTEQVMARRNVDGSLRVWRIRSQPQVVQLIALSSLAGVFVIPEGLAFPYGSAVGVSAGIAGLLLAAIPAGGAVGALLLLRLVRPARRHPVSIGMAIGCGVPLIVTAWDPWWPIVAAAWFASGLAAAYQIEVFAELARITPSWCRARTLGVAGGFLTGAQGIGLAVFGFVAQELDVGSSVALAGAVGTVGAVMIVTFSGRMSTSSSPVDQAVPV